MSTVTVRSRGGFQHEIQAGDHVFYADEPVAVGGDDTGPNPYEILLGALGACTAITIQMYAKRKGWTLGEIEIDLTHNKDYAKDCKECENKNVKIDRITRRILIRGDLSDEQRQRLMEIARRCPIHQTLTEGQIEVDDEEVRR